MTNILTGLRSNGELHLGNYIGGIQPMVRLQQSLHEGDTLFMFAPDLHSLAGEVEYSKLYQSTIDTVRLFGASGVEFTHQQTVIYRQSAISAHSEMFWLLNTVTGYGEASRMTEFKSKRDAQKNINAGLFNYPILMAGDILLYDADFIPVGDDQKQHLELTRTLAERINTRFNSEIFTVPRPWKEQIEFAGRTAAPRIKSLQNVTKKMSKSIDDPKGTISLLESPSNAAKKIMSAVTDSIGEIRYGHDGSEGVTNLIDIHNAISETQLETSEGALQDMQYGELKRVVASSVDGFLSDLQSKFAELSTEKVEAALIGGEVTANEMASKKIQQLQKLFGLRRT